MIFSRRRRLPTVDDHARALFTRRHILGLMAAGAGATILNPLKAVAACGAATDQHLVVVFANGGIRSLDVFDAYDNSTGAVDAQYVFADLLPVVGDWRLPPNGEVLRDSPARNDHTGRMAIVREVFMQTASHATGVNIALTGTSRTTAPAGSVIVANESGCVVDRDIKSLSFSDPQPAGDLQAPVAGEPADLSALFNPVDFTGHSGTDDLLRDSVEINDARFAAARRKGSPMQVWQEMNLLARAIENAGFGGALDPGNPDLAGSVAYDFAHAGGGNFNDTHAKRFAAAWLALDAGVSPVVTVSLAGFDTHSELQDANDLELATMLAVLMDKLETGGRANNTNTTIVVASDFDRTPNYNASGGTDHWLYGTNVLFGNGINPGIHGTATLSPRPGDSPSGIERQDIWASVLGIFDLNATAWLSQATPVPGLT